MYLVALVIIAFILSRWRSLTSKSSPFPDIPWNVSEVAIVFIVVAFVQILVINSFMAIVGIKAAEIGEMFSFPIALAGLVIFFSLSSKPVIPVFGLNHRRWKLQVLFGIRWATFYNGGLLLLLLGIAGMDVEFFRQKGHFYEQQNMREMLGWGGLSFLLLVKIFVGPILEELMFRGLLYSTVRKRISTWPSILIVSLVFMLAHGNNAYGAFFIGVLLCLLVEKSCSLIPAVAAHITHNLLAHAKSIPFLLSIPFPTYTYFLLAGCFIVVICTFLLEVWIRKHSDQSLTLDMVWWSVPR